MPVPFKDPRAFDWAAVQLNIVPETLLPNRILVVSPEQIELEVGVVVTVAIGIAFTVTIVVEVSGAEPTVEGVAVHI